MTSTRPSSGNPYVGPRAFQRGETLYGRDLEVRELLDLLIAERIVLLYSPSGAGKTSLVQAALISELEAERFKVLPLVRVSIKASPSSQQTAHPNTPRPNRYVLSTLLSLEEGLPPELHLPLEELAALTLGDYLDRRAGQLAAAQEDPTPIQGELVPPQGETHAPDGDLVLVFDQFEEILTVDPTDQEAKAEFFAQVGVALGDRARWALFVMREEYLAGLDPYVRPVPTRLGTSYRLELLGVDASLLAVQEPARQAGVAFTEGSAVRLVDDLRRMRVQQPDGTTVERAGPYVEPVQLQVVCRRLWDRLPAGATQVDESAVEAVGDVDTALAGYYAEQVAAVAAKTGVPERVLREWVDRQLITEQGIRGQVLQGPERSGGLDNRAIWPLVNAHLVRAEKRRGATWFELAHDRLIGPVQADNAGWRERHLSALQRQAALWAAEGRPEGLLLRDRALVEAEAWAAAHPSELAAVEAEYLAICQEARAVAERERRQARRIRWLAVGATILSILAVILAILAWSQRNRAVLAAQAEAAAYGTAEAHLHTAETAEAQAKEERERAVELAEAEAEARREAEQQGRLAQSRALAANAESNADPDLAVLLALEAIYQTHRYQPGTVTAEALSAVHHAIGRSRWVVTLGYHRLSMVYGEWSSDDTRIVTAGEDGMAVVWDAATGEALATLIGHGCNDFDVCAVLDAAWSPDDSRIVTTGIDGTARVWDAATGEELLTFRGHGCDSIGGCDVVDAAWSADGTRIVSAGEDSTVRLWDAETGTEIFVFEHRNWLTCVAWSPDGDRIMGADISGDVKIWDVTTGAELSTLEGDVGIIVDAAWSPDGARIATAGGEDRGEVWDATTGQRLSRLEGHTYDLNSVAWSPDSASVVTASRDGTARGWDAATGAELFALRGHAGWVYHAAWSPDGRRILTSSDDDTARVWDAATGAELYALGGCTLWSHYAAWSSDGTRVMATCGDGSARVWDASEKLDPFVLRGHAGALAYAAWSPDGTRIVTASDDKTAKVWDAATGTELLTLGGHDNRVNHVAWNANGKLLVTASNDNTIVLWDATTGEVVATGTGHSSAVVHIAWSPDGTRLVTASWDGTAKVWHLRSGEILTLGGPGDALDHASWSPDGTRIVTASWDGTAKVWDAATGAELFTLEGHTNDVVQASWSPDGTRIVTVGRYEVAKVWDSSTGEELLTLSGPYGWVEHAAWSPDGTRILTEDGMWDAATGELLFTTSGGVSESAWSPDGRFVVTMGSDSAKVWDANSGAELFELRGHSRLVEHAAWSPDGTRILTASSDGTARIFLVQIDGPGGLVELACNHTGRNLTYWEWSEFGGDELYRPTCPNLPTNDEALQELLDEAKSSAAAGDLEYAETVVRHAVQLAAATDDPRSANQVCWFGSIDGFAEMVLPACERAVALAGEDLLAMLRDSRGLARALTGDYAGAIEDFKAFVEWSRANGAYEPYGAMREAWVAELDAGRNPFDEETLEALRDE